MTSLSYNVWLNQATESLSSVSDSPHLDARLLLCHVLNISKTSLLTWPDREIPESAKDALSSILARRQAGEPIAYILGEIEFWGINLSVDSSVLIPRPETELVVETALDKITSSGTANPDILDLGTGSGAIAIALASELKQANITAADVSQAALNTAMLNAKRNNLEQMLFILSDWFSNLDQEKRYDIIVSNPPYVAEDDPHLENLTYEPDTALTSANNGLADIEHLILESSSYLKTDGWLMIEHGYQQGCAIRSLFSNSGYRQVETLLDLAQLERITIAQRPH